MLCGEKKMSNACMHAKRVGLEENTTCRSKIVNLPLLLVNLMYFFYAIYYYYNKGARSNWTKPKTITTKFKTGPENYPKPHPKDVRPKTRPEQQSPKKNTVPNANIMAHVLRSQLQDTCVAKSLLLPPSPEGTHNYHRKPHPITTTIHG